MGRARAYLLASLAAFYLLITLTQVTAKITDDVDIQYGNTKVLNDSTGQQSIAMSLDLTTTSGLCSKKKYVFGRFDMDMKLVAGNSAGTVTTLYMLTEGSWQFHYEIDIEFLGNSTGCPYTFHTNVYVRGEGSREKGYRLWFDPTEDFHTYTIIWTQQYIQILADNQLIRYVKNEQSKGLPFPSYQPMRVYSTIWDADNWATQGGRVKTDWSLAPFTAYFRNFKATPCSSNKNPNICGQSSPGARGSFGQDLDDTQKQRLKEVGANNMLYSYCTDLNRRIGSLEECELQ